jgi:heme exporter protein C
MKFLKQLGSSPEFYRVSGLWIPWLGMLSAVGLLAGAYWGLVVAPPDYQMGDSYRIIFVHVPAAWLSLMLYVVMAGSAALTLIWKVKIADVIAASCAVVGAWFTFLTLVSGSLWGKPTWFTWWVWDARLTSELILLFLYLGIIGLRSAIEDMQAAARACAVLALVGVVNIPIIHYSVEWWHTLHQGATVTKFSAPSIHTSMLWPLLVMAVAFMLYAALAVLMRSRCEVLKRESQSQWVRGLIRQ